MKSQKGFDAFAGVIKGGGKTRRCREMVILAQTTLTSWNSSSRR